MIVGAHHGAHEIKLHESNGISIYDNVSSHLKVVSGIPQFVTNKFGDLNLQEPKLSKVMGSSIGRILPATV
jgi:hypothetical protein